MATIIKNIFAYWQHVLNAEENSLLYNYAFPTGSVYGFGIKWRQGQQQRQQAQNPQAILKYRDNKRLAMNDDVFKHGRTIRTR